MIKFSFIIPIYNVEIKDLNRSINSITSKCDNYEIILINDGSTNLLIEKTCLELVKKNKKIKYFYQENKGAAVARNLGLDNAVGEYIFFIDADDEFKGTFFKNLEKCNFQENDISFFDFIFVNINNNKRIGLDKTINYFDYKNEIYSNILFSPNFFEEYLFGSIWSKCFKTKFLNENKIRFKPELRKAQDRMFMLEAIFYSKNIEYFPIECYKYYTNNNSISHKYNKKMITYYYDLYTKIHEFVILKKIDLKVEKFLEYNIFFELLQLTTFHMANNDSIMMKRKEYLNLYKKFNLYRSKKELKLDDFNSKKSKIKFILFKLNMFLPLYFLFHYRQIKEEKKYFYTK